MEDKEAKQREQHRKRQARGAYAMHELATIVPSSIITPDAPPLDFASNLDLHQERGSSRAPSVGASFLENIMIYAHQQKMRVVDQSSVSRWISNNGNSADSSPFVIRFLRQMCTSVEGKSLYFDMEDPVVDPLIVVVWKAEKFCQTIESGGFDSLLNFLDDLRDETEGQSEIIIVLEGLSSHLAKKGRQKKSDKANGQVNGDRVTEITVKLHVTRNISVRNTSNRAESAETLVSLARASAEKPYKMSPVALAVLQKVKPTFDQDFLEFQAEYFNVSPPTQTSSQIAFLQSIARQQKRQKKKRPNESIKTDEERRFMRSDMAVWYAQLQMFPGVSTKKAMNIIRKYPSFRSLMDAYSASESDKAKEQLLQYVLSPERRQHELSRKLYQFFSSENPFLKMS